MADETSARIENNPKLEEVTGFKDVQTSLGFVLTGSPKIKDLDTLTGLQRVEGSEAGTAMFRIQDTSIAALSVLDGVKFNMHTYFWLRLNGSLRSLPKIEGEALHVQIEENHDLTDISGLTSMSKILGSLTIFRNKSLNTCHAENVAEQIELHEMTEVRIRRNASGSCSD